GARPAVRRLGRCAGRHPVLRGPAGQQGGAARAVRPRRPGRAAVRRADAEGAAEAVIPDQRLIAVPALADNYIWLLADADGNALIVDPGEAEPVFAALKTHRLSPRAILLTHHHPDHIAGAAEIAARFAPLAVIAPHDERIAGATCRVGDGDTVAFTQPQSSF